MHEAEGTRSRGGQGANAAGRGVHLLGVVCAPVGQKSRGQLRGGCMGGAAAGAARGQGRGLRSGSDKSVASSDQMPRLHTLCTQGRGSGRRAGVTRGLGGSRLKAHAVAGRDPDTRVCRSLQLQRCPRCHKVHVSALQVARLAARAHAQAALLHQHQQRAVRRWQLLGRARGWRVAPQLKLPARAREGWGGAMRREAERRIVLALPLPAKRQPLQSRREAAFKPSVDGSHAPAFLATEQLHCLPEGRAIDGEVRRGGCLGTRQQLRQALVVGEGGAEGLHIPHLRRQARTDHIVCGRVGRGRTAR